MKRENKLILTLVMVYVLMCVPSLKANRYQQVTLKERAEKLIIKDAPKLTAVNVTVTSYHAEKWVTKTADGSKITPGVKWCAISKDLMKRLGVEFGDTLIYNDVGYAVRDLTHNRLKNTVDILVHDRRMIRERTTVYFK